MPIQDAILANKVSPDTLAKLGESFAIVNVFAKSPNDDNSIVYSDLLDARLIIQYLLQLNAKSFLQLSSPVFEGDLLIAKELQGGVSSHSLSQLWKNIIKESELEGEVQVEITSDTNKSNIVKKIEDGVIASDMKDVFIESSLPVAEEISHLLSSPFALNVKWSKNRIYISGQDSTGGFGCKEALEQALNCYSKSLRQNLAKDEKGLETYLLLSEVNSLVFYTKPGEFSYIAAAIDFSKKMKEYDRLFAKGLHCWEGGQ